VKRRGILVVLLACVAFHPRLTLADEGGVSFWLPGNFGSFVATPGDPGWTLPLMYYYSSADAGADKTFPRAGRFTAGVDASGSFVFVAPTYVLATPVAGGQASWGLAVALGHLGADVDATLNAPLGGVVSGSENDARTGFSDLYPTASLKWNRGVHNSMVYLMAGVPVGAYDVGRLANLGTNHGAIDGGGGYTYLDPKKGRELSAAVGFTYNFENPDTRYRNGLSSHLDWAASHFFSETFHAGVVGYVYYQLTGDSGSGAKLGDFKSQVAGLGPQAGRFFEIGGRKCYVNLKGYWEFSSKNRPEGWNAWLAFAIPLTGKK
jgi:hypothetical protein